MFYSHNGTRVCPHTGEQKVSEKQTLQVGLEEKAKEFVEKGADVARKHDRLTGI
jgi:hypothetical protein